MEVSWRNVRLVDLDGALTSEGIQLLKEFADEPLAPIVWIGDGGAAQAQQRRQLVGRILQDSQEPSPNDEAMGVMCLASVLPEEMDYTLLLLDVRLDADSFVGNYTGIFCMLASLLVVCHRPKDLATALDSLRPFVSLAEHLTLEQNASELNHLRPALAWVDLSAPLHRRSAGTPPDLLSNHDLDGEFAITIECLNTLQLARSLDFSCLSSLEQAAKVKNIFGTELTGELLLSMLRSSADQIQKGLVPELLDAWDHFVQTKCKSIAHDGLATYSDCIHESVREMPPMEMDAFESLNEELQRLALDVFHTNATFHSSRSRRLVKKDLKQQLQLKCQEELKVLRANSTQFCRDKKQSLWTKLLAQTRSKSVDDLSAQAMLVAIQTFVTQYNSEARGPEKTNVLLEFYQHEAIEAFKELDNLINQKRNEEQVKELREQLERDFREKKEALIAHFKQEEAQLRAAMAKEVEMFQRINETKNLRGRIDEKETKRVREELATLKRQLGDTEAIKIALEHAQEDLKKQKKSLETRVEELEESVRHEMGNRAELVETLADTMKKAQQREEELEQHVKQLEESERTASHQRMSQVNELAAALKKTNEEKEELQKKLNQFFLRITCLPPSLQQQMVGPSDGNDDEEIRFSDALTTYMTTE